MHAHDAGSTPPSGCLTAEGDQTEPAEGEEGRDSMGGKHDY
jgi:hypothetical protein